MTTDRLLRSVTCLGCGCGCDDLTVRVRGGRIVEMSPPCPVAKQWFGDGSAPQEVRVDGRPATVEQAVHSAAAVLSGAERPMVLIGPDLTTEAQRAAIALADVLRAEIDGATSDSAAAGIQAAQRRGRAGATLGEIRNRADVVLFWAVDPAERYPRFVERYVSPGASTHVKRRALLSVSVGTDRGPSNAELQAEFTPAEEVDALAVMLATIRGQRLGELPPRLKPAATIAERLAKGSYVAIVHDAEAGQDTRDPQRTEGLVALAQVLNDSTRAALSTLRAGGNRSGAEAALTWQTGYPLRVTFRSGYPQAQSGPSGLDRLRAGCADVVLVVGSVSALKESGHALDRIPAIVIGPAASALASAISSVRVAIDTGIAGIHEAGTGYRMDEVPLPLSPSLEHPHAAADTLRRLLGAIRRHDAARAR